MSDQRGIGIFDSGIGGLTVLAALRARLPGESFIYLGDTARLPYGTKSPATIQRYALRAALALTGHDIKMLVIACNTATSAALPVVQHALTIPVVGVVDPGARTALGRSRGRVGIIGTESTIASGAYERAIHALGPDIKVIGRACPLFVPLAEEGWFDHPVTREVARIYLEPLNSAGIDTLVLGCTHYPLLRDAIAGALAPGVLLVDSAQALAEEVARLLDSSHGQSEGPGGVRVLVTDAAQRVARIAEMISPGLGRNLELIDLQM